MKSNIHTTHMQTLLIRFLLGIVNGELTLTEEEQNEFDYMLDEFKHGGNHEINTTMRIVILKALEKYRNDGQITEMIEVLNMK